MLLRNPCKNLESYDNPFWGKSKEGNKKKRKEKREKSGKIPKIVVTLVAPLAHATRSDQNTKNSGFPKLLS